MNSNVTKVIQGAEKLAQSFNTANGMMLGLICQLHQMSDGDIRAMCDRIKALEHHEAQTVGLYATDRIDLINDPLKVMYEITPAEQGKCNREEIISDNK